MYQVTIPEEKLSNIFNIKLNDNYSAGLFNLTDFDMTAVKVIRPPRAEITTDIDSYTKESFFYLENFIIEFESEEAALYFKLKYL